VRIVVPGEAAGERLDRFLAAHLGSRAAAERAVEAGALVDGTARAKSFRLAGGEQLDLPEAGDVAPVPAPARPPVVWEDEHLLVVDKPAGLVVHPGAGHAAGTLVDALRGESAGGDAERPGIVHRLDRDTSGLLVVERSD
jgi:23S rRNA pseudouridine1911/1915/1917 synthase